MKQLQLKDYRGHIEKLIFSTALYKEIIIDLDITTESTYETIGYDDEDIPDIISFESFIESQDIQLLKKMVGINTTVVGYCPFCGKLESIKLECKKIDKYMLNNILNTNHINSEEQYDFEYNCAEKKQIERLKEFKQKYLDNENTFTIKAICTKKHIAKIIFYITDDYNLIKIGQYPSTINYDQTLKEYNKIINKNDIYEIRKAIGLKSHDVGVAAFVYLRRVFEKLIYAAYKEYDSDFTNDRVTKKKFKNLHMEEKIKKLDKYLPKHLKDNIHIYGILSKGIHELTEKECLRYFDDLYDAIIIILKEKKKLDDDKIFKKNNADNIKDIATKTLNKKNKS
ncbi:MAG: hypothetical protein A2Y24_02005 [Clostridiales bacterium GWE2_32_10]|nr:MAG: hypothetical protein A2Y24_02005 [Clostridiales bacterium GWE2_32_10]HBY20076.1 hypothetical protein [Clostridiales bacterium]